jgi:multidrug resistance protein, MATE family
VILVELRRMLRLAFPIVVTQLSQMGMGVADTVMAGRYGAADLAGVALGGNLYWPAIMLLSGILMAITPTVAQLHGKGDGQRAGEVVRQAAWIGFAGGMLLLIALRQAETAYRFVGVDPAAIPIAVAYLDAVSWGIVPFLGYFALRYLCEGMSWTLPAMLIAFLGLVLKIPLNYLFIHGFSVGGWTLPAQGGAGCGWASALVMSVEFLVMAAVVARSRMRASGVFARFSRPDPAAIGRLVRLGLPIGITVFFEISLFSVVTLMIGRLGVEAVAAHQIAMNIGALAFMVPMAIGAAASIRVGFNVGAGDLAGARRSGWIALGLTLAVAVVLAVLVLAFRGVLAGLYTTDATVLLLAADLLLFVAFWQLVDDTQVTAIGALRGFKDTRVPMFIALVAYWLIGMPIGMLLGFEWIGVPAVQGLRGFWIGLACGLAVASVVLVGRFAWLSRQESRILALAHR